ncbi:hypothetical protein QFW94_15700 [Bacillus velezensis]|uniref:Uncharacterized protein n=1 Tax=Bacillus siamensis TaxID=659243 RepID=A0AAI8HQ82_9BACI|nr:MULTISPECIES: hypothetical protein [Bacillales]AUJ78170.1 hypothetical protein CWD84_15710 [Bacillus siamensis]MBL3611769.1 hypothetical protein [Bacillus sp. RHFS18]MCZ0853318.1 hypothetical protein [Brevibacillus laterosporus]MDH5842624.1 hypothetical protein [Bacillus velezensis]PAE75125.1 hypothetical protein CHH82_16360 [Bacillus velezensis]
MNLRKFELAASFLRHAQKAKYSEEEIKGAVSILHKEFYSLENAIESLTELAKVNEGAEEIEHRKPDDSEQLA